MATTFFYGFGLPSGFSNNEDDYYATEDFEFEIDTDEAVDYILRSYTPDEIIEDFIELVYENLPYEDKESLRDFGGFDGTFESLDKMSDEDKISLSKDIVLDMITEYDVYDDVLQDYFEQEAYDEWEDDQDFHINY